MKTRPKTPLTIRKITNTMTILHDGDGGGDDDNDEEE
jgi:hypothetical protein